MTTTAIAPAAPPTTALVEQRGFVNLTSLAEAERFAAMLVLTEFVPKDYRGKEKIGHVVIAMQYGLEIGLPPLQALQCIAVINGRPAIYGDGLRALILSAPDLERLDETNDGTVATCTIARRGRSVTRSFSMEDAKRAKLAGKEGPWTNYPSRMLGWRAFGWAARDAYADRLKGIWLAEEAGDVDPDDEPREPKRVEGSVVAQETPAPAGSTNDGGVRRGPADQGGSTPPASTTPPANGTGADQPATVTRRAKILSTAFVGASGNKREHWLLETEEDGQKVTYLIAEEGLYKEAASCEGTDHRFALTWKLVRRADKSTGRMLLQIEIDDEDAGQ